MAFNLKPVRYTFLSDNGLSLDTAWGWAKKLINDLHNRDAQIIAAINSIDTTVEETTEVTATPLVEAITVVVTDPNGDDVTAANGLAVIPIDATLDGWRLADISARITTEATSDTTVQFRRTRLMADNVYQDTNLLSTIITIQAGERSSTRAEGLQPVVDEFDNLVATDDENWIDVLTAGAGAKGLSVTAVYVPPEEE